MSTTTPSPPERSASALPSDTLIAWQPDLASFTGPLYHRLAEAIASAVATGLLAPGDRLPTHRDLARTLGVTPRTVTRAYQTAAAKGLTAATTGRGSFIATRPPEASPTQGPNPFRAGDIDLALNALPVGGQLQPFRRALAGLAGSEALDSLLSYMPPGGLVRHREAGAVWAALRGVVAEPVDITVCSGTQHAIFVILQELTEPGDTVLTEILSFPGIRQLADQLRIRLIGVATDRVGMLPDALDRQCQDHRPAAVVLTPSGQNPTTATSSPSRRMELANVLARHGVPFIEDDVAGHAVAAAPLPIVCSLPHQGYYVCGTSKSIAPGLRVGYVVAPSGCSTRLAQIVHATTWSVSGLAAEITSRLIAEGAAQKLVAWHRRESAQRAEIFAAALPASVDFRSVPGLYHGWLELPAPWLGAEFATRLAQSGVRVTPAEVFAVDDAPVPQAVRISMGGPALRDQLHRVARTLRRMLDHNAATPIHAIT